MGFALRKTICGVVKCWLFSKASSTQKSGVNLPHRRKIEQLTFQAIASCQGESKLVRDYGVGVQFLIFSIKKMVSEKREKKNCWMKISLTPWGFRLCSHYIGQLLRRRENHIIPDRNSVQSKSHTRHKNGDFGSGSVSVTQGSCPALVSKA